MSLASVPYLCYQAPMTDSNDDNRKGRPSGRSDRGRTSGDRPSRKPREGGERPFRARGDDERPRKPREAGDRPFRSRDNDERPRRPAKAAIRSLSGPVARLATSRSAPAVKTATAPSGAQ